MEVQDKPIKIGSMELSGQQIIADYRLAYRSRQASLLGRREVMSGKAKFGIFGDGKEVAQIALAKAFRPGDFRSGYYRDQTLMFALGVHTLEEFFAQLYADTDLANEPATAGRSMNCHFATRALDENGVTRTVVHDRGVGDETAVLGRGADQGVPGGHVVGPRDPEDIIELSVLERPETPRDRSDEATVREVEIDLDRGGGVHRDDSADVRAEPGRRVR